MRHWIIVTGAVLLAAGLCWPWLGKLGLGHLPGDLSFRGQRFSFYFPITTCIVVSLALSFLVWLLHR
ncbi:MAG TPA: DUF2905 domain-containing protein [Acidocella sp.]|nr:DUF2905 domain-containing protein [Acidocella sp.]